MWSGSKLNYFLPSKSRFDSMGKLSPGRKGKKFFDEIWNLSEKIEKKGFFFKLRLLFSTKKKIHLAGKFLILFALIHFIPTSQKSLCYVRKMPLLQWYDSQSSSEFNLIKHPLIFNKKRKHYIFFICQNWK